MLCNAYVIFIVSCATFHIVHLGDQTKAWFVLRPAPAENQISLICILQ